MTRFFHIGLDWCGEAGLARLFRMNGQAVAAHEAGRLAEDIAFSVAAGQVPLQGWPEARLFSGLHRLERWGRPPIEAWRWFPALDAAFPGAVFILPRRNPDAWVVDRMTRRDGILARIYAHFLRVPVADLPALWLAGWRDHMAAVQAHFGDDPRLVRVDLDRETPADLGARLAPWLKLPKAPDDWQAPPDPGNMVAAMDRIEDNTPPAILRSRPRDPGFVQDVAGFCLRGAVGGDGDVSAASRHYARWDGGDQVLDAKGQPRPVAPGHQPVTGQPCFYAAPGHLKLERVEGVLNQMLRLGRRDPVHMDMEDSRWFGTEHDKPLGAPVLVHNRRNGAVNPVLWPLPGFHDLGQPGFATPDCPDPIPFQDKIDRVVWRGNISGSVMKGGRVRPGPASHSVLRRLAQAGDNEDARQEVWRELRKTSRLRFVRRHIGHPDFDVGLVLAWGLRNFADDPLLRPFIAARRGSDYFQRFRYQLCLTGYDHGSNFIGAINSQSVLLKEEDGWEVFYSGRFRPWQHYIPVARYCDDIHEKLAWARAHPAECRAMSAAARAEVALLSDEAMRHEILHNVLDGVAALA